MIFFLLNLFCIFPDDRRCAYCNQGGDLKRCGSVIQSRDIPVVQMFLGVSDSLSEESNICDKCVSNMQEAIGLREQMQARRRSTTSITPTSKENELEVSAEDDDFMSHEIPVRKGKKKKSMVIQSSPESQETTRPVRRSLSLKRSAKKVVGANLSPPESPIKRPKIVRRQLIQSSEESSLEMDTQPSPSTTSHVADRTGVKQEAPSPIISTSSVGPGITIPVPSASGLGHGVGSPLPSTSGLGHGVGSPLPSASGLGHGVGSPLPSASGLGHGVGSPLPSASGLGHGVGSPLPSASGLGHGVGSPLPSASGLGHRVGSPLPSASGLGHGVGSPLPSSSGLEHGVCSPLPSTSGLGQGITSHLPSTSGLGWQIYSATPSTSGLGGRSTRPIPSTSGLGQEISTPTPSTSDLGGRSTQRVPSTSGLGREMSTPTPSTSGLGREMSTPTPSTSGLGGRSTQPKASTSGLGREINPHTPTYSPSRPLQRNTSPLPDISNINVGQITTTPFRSSFTHPYDCSPTQSSRSVQLSNGTTSGSTPPVANQPSSGPGSRRPDTDSVGKENIGFDGKYKCIICREQFETKEDFEMHVNDEYNSFLAAASMHLDED